jgi:lysophospholipase L1-like esterase
MILKRPLVHIPCKVLCLGDSQTLAYTYGIKPTEYWPYQLKSQGLTSGYSILDINSGNAGWTTTQLLAITQAQLTRFKPKVLIIYCGVNDPGNGIASGTTKTNIQSMVALSYAAGVEYTMIVNTNYLNYSTGGDNAGAGTYYQTYVDLRVAQAAAASYCVTTYGASAVCYADLFTYQKNLVLAGTWTQGAWASSHIADLSLIHISEPTRHRP